MDVVLGTRTAVGFTREQVVTAEDSVKPIVGFAKTAKIRAASPPLISPDRVYKNRIQYYEYLVDDEKYPVAVIEDTDYPNQVGAFWGELNVAVHKGLKIRGTVTNGLLRDLGMLDEGYQVIAGGIGPSHAFVHITDLNVGVNIFGLEVYPGDLIHADRHGAVVVPEECVKELPSAIDILTRREAIILEVARSPGFNVDILKKAMADSAEIH